MKKRIFCFFLVLCIALPKHRRITPMPLIISTRTIQQSRRQLSAMTAAHALMCL